MWELNENDMFAVVGGSSDKSDSSDTSDSSSSPGSSSVDQIVSAVGAVGTVAAGFCEAGVKSVSVEIGSTNSTIEGGFTPRGVTVSVTSGEGTNKGNFTCK